MSQISYQIIYLKEDKSKVFVNQVGLNKLYNDKKVVEEYKNGYFKMELDLDIPIYLFDINEADKQKPYEFEEQIQKIEETMLRYD